MRHSAGVLLYRWCQTRSAWQILLVKPGGPFWQRRTERVYGVPKGLFDPDREDAVASARREFFEEIGTEAPPQDRLTRLGTFRVSSSKTLHIWTSEQGKVTAAPQ